MKNLSILNLLSTEDNHLDYLDSAYSYFKGNKLSNYIEKSDFYPQKDMISVIFPILNILDEKLLISLYDYFLNRDNTFEFIIIISGFGYVIPEKLANFIKLQNVKLFYYPDSISIKRLVNKGIKEARGEFFLKPEFFQDFLNNTDSTKNILLENKRNIQQDLPIKISYLVPNLGVSGGINIIINQANRLLDSGYDVSIISKDINIDTEWIDCYAPIYPLFSRYDYFHENLDILIASFWADTFDMIRLPSSRKIYFVQGDARNPQQDSNITNMITYSYNLDCEFMTEAIWIQRWLKDEFNKEAYYVPNAIDDKVFYPSDQIIQKGNKPRILIEGPVYVWSKGVDTAYNSVKDLDVELWIVSSSGKPPKHWRYQAFFQDLPIEEMRKIYSSCDILLKMSFIEGFSGPPLEAMACGCAVVVGKVTGYDEYIENGYNALVVEPGDCEGARLAVKKITTDSQLRERLINNGFITAKKWNYTKSMKFLNDVIHAERPIKYYSEHSANKYCYKKHAIFLNKVYKIKIINEFKSFFYETIKELYNLITILFPSNKLITTIKNILFKIFHKFYKRR